MPSDRMAPLHPRSCSWDNEIFDPPVNISRRCLMDAILKRSTNCLARRVFWSMTAFYAPGHMAVTRLPVPRPLHRPFPDVDQNLRRTVQRNPEHQRPDVRLCGPTPATIETRSYGSCSEVSKHVLGEGTRHIAVPECARS